jgi:MFS family permease
MQRRAGSYVGVLEPIGPAAGRRGTLGNLLGLTAMVVVTFGVFMTSIADEFGWSRAATAGGFTMLSLANAIAFPIAGRLADRFGTRPVLVTGFVFLALATMALSQLPPNPLVFYAMMGLAGAIGAFPSMMILAKLLSEWFDSSRGLWLGVCSGVGNGLGGTIMPIVAVALMKAYGWRHAFLLIGLTVLLVAVPVAWATLRPPPARFGGGDAEAELSGMEGGEALRSPLFWLLIATNGIGGGALVAFFASTLTVLTSRGIGEDAAASVVAAFALICTVWEPLTGFVLDRGDRPRLIAPFFVMAAGGVLLLAYAHSFPLLMLGGLLSGIGLASNNALTYLLSRYFGLRAMGAISGVAFVGVLGSMAVAPVLLNYGYDRSGSYALGLNALAVLLVATTIVFLRLPHYPRLKPTPPPAAALGIEEGNAAMAVAAVAP